MVDLTSLNRLSPQGLKTYAIVILVCGLALGLRLTLSYYSLIHLPPSSDEAIAMMLAESISRGEDYPLLFTGQPYQFPIEAYLKSVAAQFFSHGSLQARYQTLLLGMIGTFGFLAVAYRIFGEGERWPAMLLIALPSAYWLTQLSAYAPPQYAISNVLAALLFFLTVLIIEKRSSAIFLVFLAGVVAGLALSNHLLLISVVIPVFLTIVFNGHRVYTLARVPAFTVGFLLGLVPFILAMITIPGAYEGIATAASLPYAVDRFFNLVLPRALAGAMGVNPPYFGDFLRHVDWGQPLGTVFAISFSVFFIGVVLSRIRPFVIASKEARWPSFSWPDIFILTTILSLVLMAMNARGAAHDHRYLIPVVWSFPFLMGYTYSLCSPSLRPSVGVVVVLLALFNVSVSLAVIDKWRRPGIWFDADIPHLTDLRTFLNDQNVRYCYATFWLAYRITYETDDEIICAPVFNERFKGWPLPPVKQIVDQQNPVAFVLSDTVGGKFRSRHFKKILEDYGIVHKHTRIGVLSVYHDFNYPTAQGEQVLTLNRPGLVSATKGTDYSLLTDGKFHQSWKPEENQKKGQQVELDLGEVSMVQRVTLHYPHKKAPPPRFLSLYGRKENTWINLASRVPYRRDEMRFVNGHPILGGIYQTFRFSAKPLDRIRIEIIEPSGDHPWTLSEIEVGIKVAGLQ